MKRKIIAIILAIALIAICALSLASCNVDMGIGNYSFRHAHFSDGFEGHCATVNSWHDNDIGIEVKTAQYGSLYLSEGSYILVDEAEHCPFCH